jgi:transcription initiation factor IIE alpha subunit
MIPIKKDDYLKCCKDNQLLQPHWNYCPECGEKIEKEKTETDISRTEIFIKEYEKEASHDTRTGKAISGSTGEVGKYYKRLP